MGKPFRGLAQSAQAQASPQRPEDVQIPQILHQTWKTDQIPVKYRHAAATEWDWCHFFWVRKGTPRKDIAFAFQGPLFRDKPV